MSLQPPQASPGKRGRQDGGQKEAAGQPDPRDSPLANGRAESRGSRPAEPGLLSMQVTSWPLEPPPRSQRPLHRLSEQTPFRGGSMQAEELSK